MTPRAVVFDVMGTLFDLSPLGERLSALGAPSATLEAWFGRLLHSATSLTLAGEFRPFAELARSALETTLARLDVDVAAADEVLAALGRLPPHDDAAEALAVLADAGLPILALTNGGADHTRGLLDGGGLLDRFRQIVTTEEVRAYKPHPAPYRRAVEAAGATPGEVTLVAAHGWDVVGARAAGLDAVWVDRLERRWPFPTPEPRRAPDLVEAARLVLAPPR